MSGIIGVFNKADAKKSILAGMKVIEYRGHDGFGLSNNEYTEFCKELDDLEKGEQEKNLIGYCLSSLHSVSGFYPQPIKEKGVLIADCRIYNWKELNKKYELNADNDALMLIRLIEKKLIEKKGEEKGKNGIAAIKEVLEEIDGSYAFAYWHENVLMLARDIIGIKPLWFSLNDEGDESSEKSFAFASEKKALRQMGFENIEEINPREIIEFSIPRNKLARIKRKFFSIKPEIEKNEFMIKRDAKELLINAIKKRLPKGKFGILFSGGIDSTFLAYVCKFFLDREDFICYTAALDSETEAEDIMSAQDVAREYGFELKTKKISLEETEKYLKKVIPLIEDDSVVKAGVALPFFIACEEARKDNIKVVLSGLGSEEIFAGYERHKISENINEECLAGLLEMHKRDTYRDNIIAASNGLELRLPFLDKDLIDYALKIPAKYKLDKETGEKKIILRRIAKDIDIKKEFAERKKRAAQYGSRFDKALEKLSKRKGLNKSDYLKKFYNKESNELGALFSSGKDSCYAIWKMLNQNYNIKCLITIDSKNPDSYMFHTPNIKLAKKQAEAMDMPIIIEETAGEKEKELADLDRAIKKAVKEYNIKGIVCGALFSNYQKQRIEKLCNKNNLRMFAPLWQLNQEEYMRQLIKDGFEILVSSIAAYGLNKSWLGKKLTEKDIDKLVEINKKVGINIAFEGGEAETLAIDGPIFNKKIEILEAETIIENEYTGKFVVKKAILINK